MANQENSSASIIPQETKHARPRNLKQVTPKERFGRLITVKRAGHSRDHQPLWECICDCGGSATVTQKRLKNGSTQSCGCLGNEARIRQGHLNAKHGDNGIVNGKQSPTVEYQAWRAMIGRCYNSKTSNYHLYGGRGIKVCDEWRRSYSAFLAYIGRRPSPRHSLDRFPDNDGNYEPGNVRWATQQEQGRNRRTNVTITINGETRCVREWAELSGIGEATITHRLKSGWETSRLLSPVIACFSHKKIKSSNDE